MYMFFAFVGVKLGPYLPTQINSISLDLKENRLSLMLRHNMEIQENL